MRFAAPERAVTRVFLHCSASDRPEHDNVATIRKWHLARGFNDVGYHYYVRKDGTTELGRSVEIAPAAQEGHNRNTIAICLGGLKAFTDEQFDTLYELCSQINEAIPGVTFHGHCEVNPNKTCPVFSYREVLNLDSKGRMA